MFFFAFFHRVLCGCGDDAPHEIHTLMTTSKTHNNSSAGGVDLLSSFLSSKFENFHKVIK
jgi:hypothetical protein